MLEITQHEGLYNGTNGAKILLADVGLAYFISFLSDGNTIVQSMLWEGEYNFFAIGIDKTMRTDQTIDLWYEINTQYEAFQEDYEQELRDQYNAYYNHSNLLGQ